MMTDTNTDPAKPEVPEVSTNPAALVFPADKWGYTSKMRKELLAAAMTIKGQPDKAKLFLATLDLVRAHVIARFAIDRAAADQRHLDAQRFAGLRNEYTGSGRK